VRDYLVARGIDSNRVDTISYGKERPVAVGANEESRAQNRRGVTVVN
jgi:peptidoglycan-associated lipoprotein